MKKILICTVILHTIMLSAGCGTSYYDDIFTTDNFKNIKPMKETVGLIEEWLQWKIDNFLPKLMEQQGIEMWIITDDDSRIFPFLMPAAEDGFVARRTYYLMVYHKEGEEGVERRLIGNSDSFKEWGPLFPDHVFTHLGSLEMLAEAVRELNPQKIAAGAAWDNDLEVALGSRYSSRLVNADLLSGLWSEYRTPQQLEAYKTVIDITHDIIAEAFSSAVVTPGVTTTDDVNWWVKQKASDLGFDDNFGPTVMAWRSLEENKKYGDPEENFRIDIPPHSGFHTIIQRGDVLSCDIGIRYLGLSTDIQQVAYVLKEGEPDAPEGLKEALRRGNRLQDLVVEEFAEGRTGNEILFAVLERANTEGLRPEVYCHTMGTYVARYGFKGSPLPKTYAGYGPSVGSEGLFDENGNQLPTRNGERPVHTNTIYSMELDITYAVPEWNDQDIRIVLEEDVAFTAGDGLYFPGGRQTEYLLIR